MGNLDSDQSVENQEYDFHEPDKPTASMKKTFRLKLADLSREKVTGSEPESRKDSKKPMMNNTSLQHQETYTCCYFNTVADAIQALAVALSHDRSTPLGDLLHSMCPSPLELTAIQVLCVRSRAAKLETDDMFEKVNVTIVQAVVPKEE